jgi:YegS/Rv2252/BmrU family lipid kinase
MTKAFHQAVLIYNPVSGGGAIRRGHLPQILEALSPLADEILVEPTRAAGSAGEQVREALAKGCDLILACGGDGTAFDVLQGVTGTNAVLGVLPFGTANVLASDLGLPQNPLLAARKLATYQPRRVPVGRIVAPNGQSRYFTVAAGAGLHAHLIAKAGVREKGRKGFLAYYISGIRMIFANHFQLFEVEITHPDGSFLRQRVWETVAMRVSSFGRFLRLWRPGSSLESPYLQLVLLRESSRWRLGLYVLQAVLGLANKNSDVQANFEILSASQVVFRALPGETVRAQADGELLGSLPERMEVVPGALNLLMPPL